MDLRPYVESIHQQLADGSYLTKVYACTADRLHDRNGDVVRVIAYTHDDPHRTGSFAVGEPETEPVAPLPVQWWWPW